MGGDSGPGSGRCGVGEGRDGIRMWVGSAAGFGVGGSCFQPKEQRKAQRDAAHTRHVPSRAPRAAIPPGSRRDTPLHHTRLGQAAGHARLACACRAASVRVECAVRRRVGRIVTLGPAPAAHVKTGGRNFRPRARTRRARPCPSVALLWIGRIMDCARMGRQDWEWPGHTARRMGKMRRRMGTTDGAVSSGLQPWCGSVRG